jgi:hypothetical protein
MWIEAPDRPEPSVLFGVTRREASVQHQYGLEMVRPVEVSLGAGAYVTGHVVVSFSIAVTRI